MPNRLRKLARLRPRGFFDLIAAHASIRWNNQILGDLPSHVATFTEVDDIRVLGRS